MHNQHDRTQIASKHGKIVNFFSRHKAALFSGVVLWITMLGIKNLDNSNKKNYDGIINDFKANASGYFAFLVALLIVSSYMFPASNNESDEIDSDDDVVNIDIGIQDAMDMEEPTGYLINNNDNNLPVAADVLENAIPAPLVFPKAIRVGAEDLCTNGAPLATAATLTEEEAVANNVTPTRQRYSFLRS